VTTPVPLSFVPSRPPPTETHFSSMPRRSTRLEAKPLPAAEDADSDTAGVDDFEPSDADSIEDPPPRKRRKTTNGPYSANKGKRAGKRLVKTASFDPKWRHTKGRQGLLKQLVTEAPLDVLFEVRIFLE
jgi:hypothetical protein